MKVEIINRPGNAVAHVTLVEGETCTAEAGAMIAMSPSLRLETSTYSKKSGGFLAGIKRIIGGESFFLNHYTASSGSGDIYLGTLLEGDMNTLSIENKKWVIESGAFVACETGVHIETGWQGFKSFFSGEGLFWLEAYGLGQTIIHSYGAFIEIEVDGDFIVDTGHIVAFEESLNFKISKPTRSWMQTFFSGEGFVCHFSGKGKLIIQSHNRNRFGKTLGPLLLRREEN